ncbi:MAG: peptidoglycan-binding protein, partial [Patescibacteria group bacterium]
MRTKFLVGLLAVSVGFVLAQSALAVTVSEAITLTAPTESGSTNNVTMSANSTFDSMTVTATALLISVSSDQSVTLTSSDARVFKNDQSVQTVCNTTSSSITLSSAITYAIQMGGACSQGGGGGAGTQATPPPPPSSDSPGGSTTPPPPPSDSGSSTTPPPPSTDTTIPPPATTTPPPSMPTLQVPTKELSLGMKDDQDVMKLQVLLASDTSLYPEGLITGNFGPKTEAAVKKFQTRHGISPVGRVGPMTLAKLMEIYGSGSMTAPTPAASTGGKLTRELAMGDEGDDVKTLQSFLAADPSLYPEGLITGYFGGLTKAAVQKFQTRHGISPVGRVGPMT